MKGRHFRTIALGVSLAYVATGSVHAGFIADVHGAPYSDHTADALWQRVVSDHHATNPHTPLPDPDHHAGDPHHSGDPHHTGDPHHPSDPHHTTDPHEHHDDDHPTDPHHHGGPTHHNSGPHHHAGDAHAHTNLMHLMGITITTDAGGNRFLHVLETDLGDLTGDGLINHQDAVRHFGGPSAFQHGGTSLDGDVNYVRFADGIDALVLLDTAHFPESFSLPTALASLSGNVVPEPSSVAVVGVAGLALTMRRFRRT